MRIIAGTRRSLPLKTLEGDTTRPTADKYKETLFNCLQADVPGSRFLDLFAGSGSIGIEALSRGAKHAVFVENDRDAIGIIRENIRFTRFADQADILKMDALGYLRNLLRVDFNLIYIDPPYGKGLERKALEILNQKEWKDPDMKVIMESRLDEDYTFLEQTRFEIYKEKDYRTNKHVFLRRREEA